MKSFLAICQQCLSNVNTPVKEQVRPLLLQGPKAAAVGLRSLWDHNELHKLNLEPLIVQVMDIDMGNSLEKIFCHSLYAN